MMFMPEKPVVGGGVGFRRTTWVGVGEVTAYTKPGNNRKETAKNRRGAALDKSILSPWLKKLCHNSVIE